MEHIEAHSKWGRIKAVLGPHFGVAAILGAVAIVILGSGNIIIGIMAIQRGHGVAITKEGITTTPPTTAPPAILPSVTVSPAAVAPASILPGKDIQTAAASTTTPAKVAPPKQRRRTNLGYYYELRREEGDAYNERYKVKRKCIPHFQMPPPCYYPQKDRWKLPVFAN